MTLPKLPAALVSLCAALLLAGCQDKTTPTVNEDPNGQPPGQPNGAAGGPAQGDPLQVREEAARLKSSNNLKQLGLAMHNYASAYDHFPAAAIVDKNGEPLLSWRVAILPYLKQENLYRQFKLNEPWDSEHNKKLIPLMPRIYELPNAPAGEGKTFYRVFSGNPAAQAGMNLSTMFPMAQGISIASVRDGTSNTIMIAESAEAVEWTRPGPMMCEPGQPLPKLGGHFPGGANVAFGDGSVRFVKLPITEEILRAMISANGGEVYSLDD